MRTRRRIASPLGPLGIAAEDGQIISLGFGAPASESGRDDPLLVEAERQLDAYFAHRLRDFDLPLLARGSSFQRAVWEAMLRIPYGRTRGYGEIADELGGVGSSPVFAG
jgi:methylated-DNA-[protein]-cysteine S-methyltransferase